MDFPACALLKISSTLPIFLHTVDTDVIDVFFNHLKEQVYSYRMYSQTLLKWILCPKKSKRSTRRQRIANFVVIVLNMTKLDTMITLQDVTLAHTAIDANSWMCHSTRWFRVLLKMEWINVNIHKGISQEVIASSKKVHTATNIWISETKLRRQNCRRQNTFIAIWRKNVPAKMITRILRRYRMKSTSKIYINTTTCILP